jgi:hypothetical protein
MGRHLVSELGFCILAVDTIYVLVSLRNLKEGGVGLPTRHLGEGHGYTPGARIIVFYLYIHVQVICVPVLICEHDFLPRITAFRGYGLYLANAMSHHAVNVVSAKIFLLGELVQGHAVAGPAKPANPRALRLGDD